MEDKLYRLLILIQENEENVIGGIKPEITVEMMGLENKEALGRLLLKAENLKLVESKYAKRKNIPSVIYWEDTRLTREGINYLKENSTLEKGYNTIRKIIDLIL